MFKCPICMNEFTTESGLRSHMVFKKNHIEELVAERDSLFNEVNHMNLVALLWRDRAKKTRRNY